MNLITQPSQKTSADLPIEVVAQALGDGDDQEQGFKLLFQAYHPKLSRSFKRWGVDSGEDISDLIQNTFFKVYKSRGQFKDYHKFGAWLFKIARNNTMDWFRQRKKKKTEKLDNETDSAGSEKFEGMESGSDLLKEAINQEQYRMVMEAIDKLPKRMRECVLMKADGYPYEEIATALRVSPQTVKSQLYQGRKRLKELLGGLFDEIDF